MQLIYSLLFVQFFPHSPEFCVHWIILGKMGSPSMEIIIIWLDKTPSNLFQWQSLFSVGNLTRWPSDVPFRLNYSMINTWTLEHLGWMSKLAVSKVSSAPHSSLLPMMDESLSHFEGKVWLFTKPNAVTVVCWTSMSWGLIGWGNYTSFFLIWTWSQSLCFWLPILIDRHWVFSFHILNKFSFLLTGAALLKDIHIFKHSHRQCQTDLSISQHEFSPLGFVLSRA